MDPKKEEKTVTIDLNNLHEGTCRIIDFGDGIKRVACMEEKKLKIFELIK